MIWKYLHTSCTYTVCEFFYNVKVTFLLLANEVQSKHWIQKYCILYICCWKMSNLFCILMHIMCHTWCRVSSGLCAQPTPLLTNLLTNDCTARSSFIHTLKRDDTQWQHYREEVEQLATWFSHNSRPVNVEKMKEMVVDFRNGDCSWRGSTTQFLWVHITDDLKWSIDITALIQKAQQHLYSLWRLKKHSTSETTDEPSLTSWTGQLPAVIPYKE